ncbi:MAG: hypothetical protein ACR2QG_08545 [Gammaproteobacteria bacterium]
MSSLYRSAAVAAFIVLTGMCIHLMNAFWLEPTYLGFVDKAKDYADMAKIQFAYENCTLSALQLCSFTFSGFAHMINGLMFFLMAVAAREAFRDSQPVLAQLMFPAGFLAGLGFLVVGINDIPGKALHILLRAENADYNTDILLMATMIRSIVNIIAITGLGLFAAILSKAALNDNRFSNWGAWFGFLLLWPALGGLVNPIAGFTYLGIVPIWLFWFGRQFSSMARA